MTDATDRILIHEVINLHGHLVDEGQFDRLSELFTDDVVYDVTAMGGGVFFGPQAVAEAGIALGDANPLSHHVTNIIVTEIDGDRALARSKGLALMTSGNVGSVVYADELRRTERLANRSPPRAPAQGPAESFPGLTDRRRAAVALADPRSRRSFPDRADRDLDRLRPANGSITDRAPHGGRSLTVLRTGVDH